MDIASLGIEVDTRGLKRGNEELGKLPNAARRAETATARMAREVNQLDRQMRAFSVGGFEGAAGRAMEASANMGRSMQLAGHQVGNMAAQFQDIGVSLAGLARRKTSSRSWPITSSFTPVRYPGAERTAFRAVRSPFRVRSKTFIVR